MSEKKWSEYTESEFLQKTRDRLHSSLTYDIDSRYKSIEDRRFYSGEQWDESARNMREAQGRPCLTINSMRKMVEMIVGDYNQSRIQFKVIPVDDESKKGAELLNKVCIDIQNKSNASYAYDWAFRMAVACGRGFWRVTPEYDSDDSFDMSPRVKRIVDPLMVSIDPYCKEADFSDMQYGFVIESMSHQDFKDEFPDKSPELAGPFFTPSLGTKAYNLYFSKTDRACYVAEYFWTERHRDTLYEVEIGDEVSDALGEPPQVITVFSSEYNRLKKDGLILRVIRKRETKRKVVMWSKVSQGQILEEPREFPCDYIPIVFCPGAEDITDGSKDYVSLVRDSKDSARAYNYARSASVENIALTPKVPYLVTPEMIRGHEVDWNSHNVAPKPYLMYNPDPMAPNGIPQKVSPPDVQAALTTEANLSMQEMKVTTGIYDAAMGQVTNEVSARAIQARESGSIKSNFAFFRSLERAIVFTGRIFVSMIQKLSFDGRKILVQSDLSGEQEMIELSGIDDGSFNVTIDTSPEYETQRKEVLASLSAYVHQSPRLAEALSDIVAEASDWPDSDKIAERIRKTLPPNLLSVEEASKRAFDDAQIERAVLIARQQVLQDSGQSQDPKAEADMMKQQIEIQKAQIDLQKAQADLEIQRLKVVEQAEKTKEQSTITDQEAQGHGFNSKEFERKMTQKLAKMLRSGRPQENEVLAVDEIEME